MLSSALRARRPRIHPPPPLSASPSRLSASPAPNASRPACSPTRVLQPSAQQPRQQQNFWRGPLRPVPLLGEVELATVECDPPGIESTAGLGEGRDGAGRERGGGGGVAYKSDPFRDREISFSNWDHLLNATGWRGHGKVVMARQVQA